MKKALISHRRLRSASSLLVAALLMSSISYLGVRTYHESHADSSPSIYVTPSSGKLAVGSAVSVTVRENSGSEPINSVQASLNYDSNTLQYDSVNESGAFPIKAATSTATAGVIRIGRANADTQLTGDNAVVTVNFKVVGSAGTSSITVDKAYSLLVRSTDNQDILQATGNGSYSVTGGSSATQNPVLYLNPSSGNVAAGSTLAVGVRLNAYSTAVTTVEAVVEYPADLLDYVNTTEGGPLAIQQRTKNTVGSIDIIRGINGGSSGLTGDNPVVVINFKVKGSAGTANLSLNRQSAIFDSSGSGTNILNIAGMTGAAYSLGAAGTVTSTMPDPTIAATKATADVSSDAKIISSSQSLSINSSGTGRATLKTGSNGQSVTELSGEVELSPLANSGAQSQNGAIQKVEYYLDRKLISTRTNTPFSYTFKTKQMKNGNYIMTIKTYYANGAVDSRVENIVVNNNVTLGYVARHYAAGTGLSLLILAVLAVLVWKLVLPRYRTHHAAVAAAQLSAPGQAGGPVAADPMVIAPMAAMPPIQPVESFQPVVQPTVYAPVAPAVVQPPVISSQPPLPQRPAEPYQSVVRPSTYLGSNPDITAQPNMPPSSPTTPAAPPVPSAPTASYNSVPSEQYRPYDKPTTLT